MPVRRLIARQPSPHVRCRSRTRLRAEQTRAVREDSRPGTNVQHSIAGRYAAPSPLGRVVLRMRSAAACHSWMHPQSQTALRCGVIEPLGYEKKSFPKRKRPPLRARVCDPIVVLFLLNSGLNSRNSRNNLTFAFGAEKRAQGVAIFFRDSCCAGVPKVDQRSRSSSLLQPKLRTRTYPCTRFDLPSQYFSFRTNFRILPVPFSEGLLR